jgi:hypothetical protein
MKRIKKRNGIIIGTVIAVIILLLAITYSIAPVRHSVRTIITTVAARVIPASNTPFPAINTAHLTKQQRTIIQLVHAQYDKHPISYDQSVLTYTQNTKEAWCADFASWIMMKSGAPYSNPNSGSWRIPGVYTLQTYYKAHDRYVAAGNYRPQVGDVAFYIGWHTFDLFSTQHVTIVIKVDGNEMTTIGGNEDGRIRVDTQPIKAGENSLVGFGKLH